MDAAADLARLLMSTGASSTDQCDTASHDHNAGGPSNKRRRLNSGVLSPAPLDASTVVLDEGARYSAVGPTCVSHSSDGTHQGENAPYQVQVKVVPPTIGGIAEASRSLRKGQVAFSTARDSKGGTVDQVSQDNSSNKALQRLHLVSFPTECFYTIACSVKIASSKSASRVLSSHSSSSLSSMSSPRNCSNDAVDVDGSSSLADAIHQPNSSLEFIASCCTDYPCVFVRGKNDALTLCQVSLYDA